MMKLDLSIKKRIYWSFALLVLLFVINGIISIITLNENIKLSRHISTVIDPSLQAIEDFQDMLVESKMYSTDWVFLRSNQDDKNALQKLHSSDYPALKTRLNPLLQRTNDKFIKDSLGKAFTGFEELIITEKRIMSALQKFQDYDDPVAKFESERIIEDEVLPRTSALMNTLTGIVSYERNNRLQENMELANSFMRLAMLITFLAITIICIGIFLSLYFTKVIISPINKIRNIINHLGKGILQKLDDKESNDEIGEMIRSVNHLSEKLQGTAAFAIEIGNRNFHTYFEPLSPEDTLGKALIAMRDNIKLSDQKLNDAQHIASIGSWEREIVTDKFTMSDEMFNILDIDRTSFDSKFQSLLRFIHPEDVENVIGTIQKNLYLPPVPFEFRIVTSKGVLKNIRVESKLILGKYGEAEKSFGILQDITERKRAEEKLAEERKLFQLVIENMPDQVYLKDTESRFVLCNKPVAINAGCSSQAEMIGKTDFDFLPAQVAKQCFIDEQSIMQSGVPLINYEEHMPDRITGEMRWSLSTKFPLKNNSGAMIGLVGINHDITQRKIAEKKLESVNRELSILFNSIDEVFFSIDMINCKVIQISNTCEKLYGYKASDFMANYRLWMLVIHPDDLHIIENEDEVMRDGDVINNQYRIIHTDNSIRWVETKITPTLDAEGKLTRVDGVTRDITDRKLAEIALLESQTQIQTIFNAALDAVIIINEEGNIVKWDSKSEILFGWKEDEVLGTSLTEIIIPHRYREAHDRGIKHFLKTGEGAALGKTIEVSALNKDNQEFDISLSVSPSLINNKYQFIGFVRDITSRKKAEKKLHASEERYRQIVETAQEGIWMIDENNNTTFINKKMCEIIEYAPEEIKGKRIHDFMDYEANKLAAERIERRKSGISETYDSIFITKSGRAVWTSLSTNPIFDDAGIYKGALAMVTDITARKQDEALLQKSQSSLEINNRVLEQKNKELEQFAYVASHDLQEPLSTTISFVELFKKQYFEKLDPKADKYLTYIVQATDRMKVLITDLLDFSRIGHSKQIEKADCNIILQQVVQDLDKAIKDSGAQIISEDLPVVRGYSTELKQLFQNLVINSIKFSKNNVLPKITITAKRKNDYWEFAFSDNGIGIDPQHNERIFIIFQRLHTRSQYQGSGIGLSHCKKIVELHHGKIWVESTPNNGSTFYFTIHSPKDTINEPKAKLHNAH